MRRLLLLSFLIPAMLVPGCRCVGSSSRPKADDAMQKKIQDDLSVRDAPKASASAGPGAFDVATRLETLRESFQNRSWESVRHDAEALLTAQIDEVTKLEVLQMLMDALREMGDKERAREVAEQFQKLYQELRDSARVKAAKADRERLAALLAKLKKRGNADRFATPEGEPRTSFKLADKLKTAGGDDVLEEKLADGSTVYYSRNPEALETRVTGASRDASVHREPEFDYYYAIAEAPPPSPAPAEKNPPDRATSGTPPK